MHATGMPRLDAIDEEFGSDPVAVVRGRHRRIMRRLWMLAALVFGAGAIAALAVSWSIADRPLRLELQSAATSTPEAAHTASQDEIDRLRREANVLASEISELKQAQKQAVETIADLRAAEQEAREQLPPPTYWYSNPEALNFAAGNPSQLGAVPTSPPPPRIARGKTRRARPSDRRAP
jgi:hypothetical protein